MAEVSGVNPNLSVSTIGDRYYSPPVDTLLLLRDYADGAETTTASETAVTFYPEATDAFEVVIRQAAVGGTIDGSNFFTITIQADNESTFTSPVTLVTHTVAAAAVTRRYALTSEEVKRLAVAASFTAPLTLVRAVATETGSTSGNLTYGAWIEPISPK